MKILEQADLFDVSISSIKKWKDEGYPTRGPLKEQIQWVRKNRPLSSDPTLTEARRQKIEVETELRRLELLIRQGELIRRSEVLEQFLWRIQQVKQGLMSLNRSLPPQWVGKDAREMNAIIKKACFELLERYSRRSGVLKKNKKGERTV